MAETPVDLLRKHLAARHGMYNDEVRPLDWPTLIQEHGEQHEVGHSHLHPGLPDFFADYRSPLHFEEDDEPASVPPSAVEPLSRYDLRMRSLDDDEDRYLCSRCDDSAEWSVWLHTPEWGPLGGATYVLCGPHAIGTVAEEAGSRAHG